MSLRNRRTVIVLAVVAAIKFISCNAIAENCYVLLFAAPRVHGFVISLVELKPDVHIRTNRARLVTEKFGLWEAISEPFTDARLMISMPVLERLDLEHPSYAEPCSRQFVTPFQALDWAASPKRGGRRSLEMIDVYKFDVHDFSFNRVLTRLQSTGDIELRMRAKDQGTSEAQWGELMNLLYRMSLIADRQIRDAAPDVRQRQMDKLSHAKRAKMSSASLLTFVLREWGLECDVERLGNLNAFGLHVLNGDIAAVREVMDTISYALP